MLVLLIEPKKIDREIIPILMNRFGLLTYVAKHLKDAYAILNENDRWKITSVIVNNEALDQKHLDFIEWVRANHQEIKTIAISCRSSDAQSCEALDIFFLRKP